LAADRMPDIYHVSRPPSLSMLACSARTCRLRSPTFIGLKGGLSHTHWRAPALQIRHSRVRLADAAHGHCSAHFQPHRGASSDRHPSPLARCCAGDALRGAVVLARGGRHVGARLRTAAAAVRLRLQASVQRSPLPRDAKASKHEPARLSHPGYSSGTPDTRRLQQGTLANLAEPRVLASRCKRLWRDGSKERGLARRQRH
jgi:hypothetical protein